MLFCLTWQLTLQHPLPLNNYSLFNLFHVNSKHYLSTSQHRYPQSERYQVSGVKAKEKYWKFIRTDRDSTRIRCGDAILIYNVESHRYLHTSQHASVMSRSFSVHTSPIINVTQDSWKLECEGDQLMTGSQFQLKHSTSGRFLKISKFYPYRYSKFWPQCPILEQLEACTVSQPGGQTVFRVDHGYFLSPSQQEQDDDNDQSDEDQQMSSEQL